jgi:outer membrane protein OmpA-like peptidoglycan-associated protein
MAASWRNDNKEGAMKKFLLAGVALALVPATAMSVSLQDVAFVSETTHYDLVSMQQGQAATTTASSPAVRSFAQEMVQYHTDENNTLKSMLPPIPSTMSPCLTWQTVLVKQPWGGAGRFDGDYVQAMIYDHQRLVNIMQGEISAGSDPNLKAYAQKALPTIQAHLAEAQKLMAGAVALPPPLTVRPTFQSGQWNLSSADQQALNGFAAPLKGAQGVSVTASGHTDNVPIGPDLKRAGVPTNQVLSEKRAGSVKDYLASQGVPPDEIHTQGFGDTKPVASNATAAGRAQNRRVEVDAQNAGGGPANPLVGTGIPSCNDPPEVKFSFSQLFSG